MRAAASAAEKWVRPRLVVSPSLEPAGRAGGQLRRSPLLRRLESFVELVEVRPQGGSAPGTSGADALACTFADRPHDADGFLLKSSSPSCNPGDAAAAIDRSPLPAVEYEDGLTDHRRRHDFLSRLFQVARLRQMPGTARAVVDFHTGSKLLLLAHSEEGMRGLGRVVANRARLPGQLLKERYLQGFALALARPARTGPAVNALMHAFGHFSRVLVASEKRLFLSLLEAYREDRSPLAAPLALIRAWSARHGSAWVEAQSFFLPYPAELQDPEGSPLAPVCAGREQHA
ncbi:MAG TPA: DUF1722 domain-containing protein [Longimicrobiales bacterium]